MEKGKKLYIASLGFLAVTLVFVILLVFTKVVNEHEEYILVERIFSKGISSLFFYIAYAFTGASVALNILSIFKRNYILHRIAFFIKVCLLILLVIPFFSSVYYEFAHEAGFFTFDLLAIAFLAISIVIEYFAVKNIEDNIHIDELIDKCNIVINFDYFLLLISGLIIIIFSFVIGDFYLFTFNYLPNVPFYFIPTLSLVFYIYNAIKLNYISSRYYSIVNIIKSRFIYYYIGYLSIIRLGYFAYSDYSLYTNLKLLRMILFLVYIAIIIFNSFLPKIDLSFLLGVLIITLFTFEVMGMVKIINDDPDRAFIFISNLLDYIIVLFIALPYYIYIGIEHLFFKRY